MPFHEHVEANVLIGAVLIGGAIGLLSGAFGKGGSAVATPLLHAIGVPAIVAVASPLPATIPSTLLASRRYARDGHVDSRLLRVGVLAGVPATVLGALLTRWIPGAPLVLATDALVLLLGLRILSRTSVDDATTRDGCPSVARTSVIVGVVGVASGLLGNSGGFLLAPLFISVLGVPVRRALGTSLALSSLLAVPGTVVHAWLGHIDWTLTLAFGTASVPLATLGAQLALRMRERALTLAYGVGLATLAGGLLVLAR